MTSVYDFSARAIDGTDVALDRYRGQALLIVNTASKCGFTGQYDGLEKLHRDFADAPFEVLGFPCNQFGQQKRGFLGSQAIKWSFTKFLTDREGRVVARYSPQTEPAAIKADIEKLI